MLALPSALERNARWQRVGPSSLPVMLVHPSWEGGEAVPVVIWIHGRTARKETDPGRYLRLMRAGIGVMAVDLPGHGERFEAARQHPRHTLDIIVQMIDEVDTLVAAVRETPGFDGERLALGGMSAGGMVTLARLCRPHPFSVASVEAATGSWRHQRHREMFEGHVDDDYRDLDPIRNVAGWREIPLQAQHAREDAWVALDGQQAFLGTLRTRYRHDDWIELVVYERTGAPFEHAGFGRYASVAKDRQRDFIARWLDPSDETNDGT